MTEHGKHNPPAPRRRVRPKAILLELKDHERAKLEWLRANRGERATLASTLRDLIMEARR